MSSVGQKERKTQQRVVKLLRETLGYAYLGNWEARRAISDVSRVTRDKCPVVG